VWVANATHEQPPPANAGDSQTRDVVANEARARFLHDRFFVVPFYLVPNIA
jgi:hypothetical protein